MVIGLDHQSTLSFNTTNLGNFILIKIGDGTDHILTLNLGSGSLGIERVLRRLVARGVVSTLELARYVNPGSVRVVLEKDLGVA